MIKEKLNEEEKKIYESLFILYKCKQAINNLWSKLKQDKELINGFDYSDTPLLYHIILEVVNFNEEYNLYFNTAFLNSYKQRITQIKIINKPIFKNINKWRLKDFRNNIIAHTWRNKGKFANPDSEYYEIPKNALESSLLVNYINYAWNLIESEFIVEFDKMLIYIQSLSQGSHSNKDYSNINEQQLKLVNEVNLKCMEFKKNYHLKVYLFDFN